MPIEEFGFRGDRVRSHTAPEIQRDIDREMQAEVQKHTVRDPRGVDERIRELQNEWDIERVLETNASILTLAGISMSLLISRKWLWLPTIVMSFLLQHAVQGWCPPIPLLRRLGVRTQREIEAERYALKALQKERMNHEGVL